MRHNEIYFLECKTPKGKLSEIQQYRLEELKTRGFKVAVAYGYKIIDY
tara:strand:+ start:6536 stop:6679 length:144 start_codon:yes stop_codon:yes gene_type:complete